MATVERPLDEPALAATPNMNGWDFNGGFRFMAPARPMGSQGR
ncbi:MAG: hypothetical protein ACYCT3_07030 [Acidiferrobacter sp.]